MKHSLGRPRSLATVLARLLDAPDLVRRVQALPAAAFSALVRRVGVEDAGEIVALATTEQLVAAFDEDLFSNARPGGRERFDAERFAIWLEVLLEAGDDVAASRVAELSEDFVTQAISALVLVLDHDALRDRMSEGGDDVVQADKALESALSEEIDGYLLVARRADGWDAALALILGLDRDYRDLLVRILDRSAAMASEYVEDLDALSELLSAEESLAEDVEAEREARRAAQGYVEARAAKSFLELARTTELPLAAATGRDPLTRAYFRDLRRTAPSRGDGPAKHAAPAASHAEPDWADGLAAEAPAPALPARRAGSARGPARPFGDAMRLLGESEPRLFDERLEELAYLANALGAGAELDGRRFRPAEAAEAALATVAWGAELTARALRGGRGSSGHPATAEELRAVLASVEADVLFRRASFALAKAQSRMNGPAFLRSQEELDTLLGVAPPRTAKRRAAVRRAPGAKPKQGKTARRPKAGG